GFGGGGGAGAAAARAANPDVVILLAGLAPTDQTGPENLSDLLFLQRVYDLGGAAWFDIVAVMVYGYGYPPSDRRTDFGRNNFSRPVQTREIMLRNGDAGTAVWAVEYGWVSLPDDWSGQPSPWGAPVSAEQQAEYLVQGYLRAQREWPWMGVMAVWTFRFPHSPDAPGQIGNPTQGFALVEHDFTPRPAYLALRERAARIGYDGTGAYEMPLAQQERIEHGEPIDLLVSGERVDLLVTGSGRIERIVDGELRETLTFSTGDQRERVTVARGMRDTAHVVSLRISGTPGEPAPEVVGYVVSRFWFHAWAYPWISAILLATLLGNLASLGWAFWDWRRVKQPVDASAPVDRSAYPCTSVVDGLQEGARDGTSGDALPASNRR
ncbi:MAG: hypothetical protein WEC79_08990, partial [Thermomicrobiales bacterium]